MDNTVPVAPGDRIELIHMPDDPCPIVSGATGTVRAVREFNFGQACGLPRVLQIGVEWDNGRTLQLIVPPDTFRIIGRGDADG